VQVGAREPVRCSLRRRLPAPRALVSPGLL